MKTFALKTMFAVENAPIIPNTYIQYHDKAVILGLFGSTYYYVLTSFRAILPVILNLADYR